MQQGHEEISRFLAEVLGNIVKTEEAYLSREFDDLSSRELHVIAAVCSSMDEGTPHTSADIAAELRVTAGTLTASVTQLEKKGYLVRQRDAGDKRIVRISATEKGAEANARHMGFHRRMAAGVLSGMSDAQAAALLTALKRVDELFCGVYAECTASDNSDRLETEK